MKKEDKICILGRSGMLGRAIWSQLVAAGYTNLVGNSRERTDLCNQSSTDDFFQDERPQYVFFTAAVAAGISYKKAHPAEMLLKNSQIIVNVMSSAARYGCEKLLNISSALIYPKGTEIPMKEECITHTALNEIDTPYVLAKAMGLQLAYYYALEQQMDFFTVVPCNFFGAYAPFEGDRAGVVPALIARMHQAKMKHDPEVAIWGTGNACREFLNSQDVASACIYLMNEPVRYRVINIGRGCEYSIREVAQTIQQVVGYEGKLVFDADKPEGRLHMQLDTTRLNAMGWKPSLDLKESIADTYAYYRSSLENSLES